MDAKGRLSIPINLRDELGEICHNKRSEFVVNISLQEWQKVESKIKSLLITKMHVLLQRFLSGATEVEIDAQNKEE